MNDYGSNYEESIAVLADGEPDKNERQHNTSSALGLGDVRISAEALLLARRQSIIREVRRLNTFLPDITAGTTGVKSLDVRIIEGQHDFSLYERAEQLGLRLAFDPQLGMLTISGETPANSYKERSRRAYSGSSRR